MTEILIEQDIDGMYTIRMFNCVFSMYYMQAIKMLLRYFSVNIVNILMGNNSIRETTRYIINFDLEIISIRKKGTKTIIKVQ